MRTLVVLGAGLLGFATVACSSDEAAAPGAGAGGSSGGDAGSGGAAGKGAGGGATGGAAPSDSGTGITISGITHEFDQQNPFATPPLAGVEVCLHDHPEVTCSTSGTDGAFALHGVPKNSKVLLSLKMAGRLSELRPIQAETSDIAIQAFENPMPKESQLAVFLPNKTVDLKKGSIVFFITTPGTRFNNGFDWLRGFKVALSPQSGDGPYYLDANHVLDPAATESVGGFGLIENMAAGDYTLAFTVPAGVTCTPWKQLGLPDIYGYPTSDPMKIQVPVADGYYTGPVGLFCAPAPTDGGADAGNGKVADSGPG